MTTLVDSIRAEYLRYKALAEAAIRQLDDGELSAQQTSNSNSIATICWHLSGNLRSRFTDFVTSDGEKPWRQREEEFAARPVSKAELLAKWEEGWEALLGALTDLTDEQLHATVTIRQQPLKVHEALNRSMAHLAYHVGQIVYIAKSLRGSEWTYLTIPPGRSDEYNRNPKGEHAAGHTATLSDVKSRP
jgi:uncharacterized damage-inducible protein DinB